MRIAIVSQYYPPDKPGRIADELARELVLRGHSVRVLTAFPHYDSGRIAPGYRQRWRHVEKQGTVMVRRVPVFASHSRNPLGRIANYLSFAWSTRFATSFVREADVIYVHGTPATAAYSPHAWFQRRGIPYVYHVQDIWPESVTGSGFLPAAINGAVEGIISAWLRKVYSRASAVAAIAPSAQQLFVDRGARPERVHLIYNWAADASAPAEATMVADLPSVTKPGVRLLYAGNLGALQDLETVIRAIRRVSDLPGLHLQIAGAGVLDAQLRDLVAELGLQDTVEFLGPVSRAEVAALYRRADFQIIPLKAMDIFTANIPSKFQAGLAHALPIITTVAGDVSDLVEEHGLGFTAAPEDEAALARAIRLAHASTAAERTVLRANARGFYDANLTKSAGVQRIEELLTSIVDARSQRRAAPLSETSQANEERA